MRHMAKKLITLPLLAFYCPTTMCVGSAERGNESKGSEDRNAVRKGISMVIKEIY